MSRLFTFLSRETESPRDAPASVLVIDDENNIRMMVRLALQHVGLNVETAADGPEGLVKFGDGEHWALVLLDQRMPGMEGLEVLRGIKKRDPRARVIMITAFGTIDLAVEAMKAGATDFLRKPFTTEMLRNAVQSALQRKSPESLPLPPDESAPANAVITPLTFGMTTINGFRIETPITSGVTSNGERVHMFTVQNPAGEARQFGVHLPAYMIELVKAHTDRDQMPGGDRFWQALCEEALANYLWQQGDFPTDATLEVDELTTGLRRWVDLALSS